jgi:Rrf2 family protein
MKLSAKTDYACRALLQLSLHWPHTTPLRIGIIAKSQQIPMKFLPHILIQLKQLGFVDSSRGKMGGYLLTKAPEQIKLCDIVQAFSENGSPKPVKQKKSASTLESIWQEIDEATQKHMNSISFEEICERERNLRDIPNFAI